MMTIVETKGETTQNTNTNVYIHGLPPSTTDEALYHMCSTYGQIVSSKSIIEPKTNLCRGYGFVMYEHLHQAQHAIYCLGLVGYEASFAKVRSDLPKQANLYISNLPTDYSEQELENLFSNHSVYSVRVLRDAQNNSKGSGFVRLSTHASAQEAIKSLDGTVLEGSPGPLQVRFAESPGRRFKPYPKPYAYHNSPPFYAMDAYPVPTGYYPYPMPYYYPSYYPPPPSSCVTPTDDVEALTSLVQDKLALADSA